MSQHAQVQHARAPDLASSPGPSVRFTRWGDAPGRQPVAIQVSSAPPSSGVGFIYALEGRDLTGAQLMAWLGRRGSDAAALRYLDLAVPGARPRRQRPEPIVDALDLLSLVVQGMRGQLPRLDERPTVGRAPRGKVRQKSAATLAATPGAVGIDLRNRGHEVSKLLYAGFSPRIHAAGYEFDDVLQEVYRGLLARNVGRCAWDPSKSSFGHYVHMVCGCILSNYHRRMRRLRMNEQVGMRLPSRGAGSGGGGARRDVDAGSDGAAAVAMDRPDDARTLMDDRLALQDLTGFILSRAAGRGDAALAVRALPHVATGMGRSEVAAVLGESKAAVARALQLLRDEGRAWRAHVTD